MGIEEQLILLSLGLVTIAVRVFLRWQQVGPSGWQLDDYLMPLTGVVFTLEVIAAYLVGAKFQGLTNSYMTDAQRAAIDPDSQEYYSRQWGSKIQVIGWSFYAFILWALKFCVATFYSRLTSGLTHLRVRVRIAYIFLALTYFAVALTILLSCQPMHKFWQINPDPGRLCRPTNSPAYVLVVVIPNVLTDLYLLSIPLPLLWGVNIGLRRRLTLMLLFSGAIFVIMAGTIRAVVIITSGPEGALSGSSWACRETFVAIVVTNLPILQPLMRRGASKIGLSGLFSKSSPTREESYELKSNDKGASGSMLDTRRKQDSSRCHPVSNSQATAWSSEERILEAGIHRKGTATDGGIVVAQEICVESEHVSVADSSRTDPAHDEWGLRLR
ncbi:hypothetical protein B0J13DRAFT_636189 [Dactylonectria estremocensis]|uniref:Rhodopsin domain-containing protein n=1 Tax=Dactylonectria estremocensis TaxID=1079267 RepID=A0A9P9J043_9HYPO|nr:hypothetical protein B0J13DRAFT_636189 [Dactylonectria estremocensis]